MYEQLKVDGVEFPPIDLDSLAPIETPTSRVRGGVWSRGSPSLSVGGGGGGGNLTSLSEPGNK